MNKSSDDWNKLKQLVDLSAENARLKAEVAYLKGEEHPYSDLGSMMPKYLLEHWINENARLKAEVERLTAEVSYDNRVQLHVDKLATEFTQVEVERLQAEVERLRKAGDAICAAYELGDDFLSPIQAWNAAKEGKQP